VSVEPAEDLVLLPDATPKALGVVELRPGVPV